MELYQASELYNQHREQLDALGELTRDVWDCHYIQGVEESYYYLQLSYKIDHRDPSQEYTKITKQRGGTRKFKNFDSVISALNQIGQNSVSVCWDAPAPN